MELKVECFTRFVMNNKGSDGLKAVTPLLFYSPIAIKSSP